VIYLRLFCEFLKIGLFAVGGGMATLPFLQHLSVQTGWFSEALITDMIAISESTPGPIGINMATYVGYHVAGLAGGIAATVGEVLPSVVIVCIAAKYLQKFRRSTLVEGMFYGMRPAVTGLIAVAGYDVIKMSLLNLSAFAQGHRMTDLFHWRKILYFVLIFILIRKLKKHPVTYIAASAAVGIALSFAAG